ncbi:hypothetical protein TNCV_1825411 [Trichonephila clavipes]|nr:hypothetical protein TNCV_1825411 [Trichonephila clavipes]
MKRWFPRREAITNRRLRITYKCSVANTMVTSYDPKKQKKKEQKNPHINGTENILLKGCTTIGTHFYGQKSSGRSDSDIVWNSLPSGRFLVCHVSSLQIFERFLQLIEQTSRTTNSLCEPRRKRLEHLLWYNLAIKCFLSH